MPMEPGINGRRRWSAATTMAQLNNPPQYHDLNFSSDYLAALGDLMRITTQPFVLVFSIALMAALTLSQNVVAQEAAYPMRA